MSSSPRYAPCANGCGKVIARPNRRSHEKLLCPQRPALLAARASISVPAQPMPQDGKHVVCGCGRTILRSRMYVHAVACDFARAAGHIPPLVRRQPCKCGCGEVVVSRGVKTSEFLPLHYDRWKWRNDPERRKKDVTARKGAPASLEEVMSASELRAMVPLEREREWLRAECDRTAALIEVGWARSLQLWGECLGVSL